MLTGVLQDLSGLIDHNFGDVSRRFQSLESASRDQTNAVQQLADAVQTVQLGDGEAVPISTVVDGLRGTISELEKKIVFLSSRGVTLVYKLDDVRAGLNGFRKHRFDRQDHARRISLVSMPRSRLPAPVRPAAASPWSPTKCANSPQRRQAFQQPERPTRRDFDRHWRLIRHPAGDR